MIRWSDGPMVRWSAGPLIRWSADPLIRWSADPMIRWSPDPMVRWSDGPMDRWDWSDARVFMCVQNERFARCVRHFSQKKLPKCSFRANFLQISQNHASKTSVSRDASDNFHRKKIQNDRFVRGFLQISRNKLPKRAFRAMLPTFSRKFRYSFAQSTHRFLRDDSSTKSKMCLALCAVRSQTWQFNVRFAITAPCAKMYESIDREPTRFAHTKMWGFTIVYAIDTTFLLKRLPDGKWNLRFVTV